MLSTHKYIDFDESLDPSLDDLLHDCTRKRLGSGGQGGSWKGCMGRPSDPTPLDLAAG